MLYSNALDRQNLNNVVIACALFSFSYISLFSGVRYTMAVILVAAFSSGFARPIGLVAGIVTHLGSVLVSFPFFIRFIRGRGDAIMPLLLLGVMGIIATLPVAKGYIWLVDTYIAYHDSLASRHLIWYMLYLATLAPMILLIPFEIKEKITFSAFTALVSVLFLNNFILLDRIAIGYFILLPFSSGSILNRRPRLSFCLLLLCFTRFSLEIQSNLALYQVGRL